MLRTFKNIGFALVDHLYPIATVLLIGHMRGSQGCYNPNLFREAASGNSYGGLLVTGLFDASVSFSTYALWFMGGSIEGTLLSLSYPMVKTAFPKTYKYGGFGAHHTILPTYLILNWIGINAFVKYPLYSDPGISV